MNIEFIKTRNIDLIESVGNHPSVQAGTCGGVFEYDPQEIYYLTTVDGNLFGVIRAKEVAGKCYECHAMFVADEFGNRRNTVKVGRAFWPFFFSQSDCEVVMSMASEEFKNGQAFCKLVGLKERGVIPKMFGGKLDVKIYSATKEELLNGWKE
ncbi:MAG: DUF2824 family protein [Plesiomonas sp.]